MFVVFRRLAEDGVVTAVVPVMTAEVPLAAVLTARVRQKMMRLKHHLP